MENSPLSIYFHWPWCKSKCPYCDFFKRVQKNVNQDDIIHFYLSELDYYHSLIPQRTIRSVFFGGGTPSLIEPDNIGRLLDKINQLWPLEADIEISLEANPNSEYPDMFKNLRQVGINRLSLGVQALNDADLRFLGRTHNLNQALHSIEQTLKYFENNSMDLIYARPNQTKEEWQHELDMATGFGFKHLSLYQLTIEENTVFAAKGVKPLNESDAAEMYQRTVDYLSQMGYPQYEVSNFAEQNFESKHNKCYWLGDEYIGIGESAHGRLNIEGETYATEYPILSGKENHQPVRKMTSLKSEDRAVELIIMGLRLVQGIDKKHFQNICGLDFDAFANRSSIKELQAMDLILNNAENIRVTKAGLLVLNQLIEQICP